MIWGWKGLCDPPRQSCASSDTEEPTFIIPSTNYGVEGSESSADSDGGTDWQALIHLRGSDSASSSSKGINVGCIMMINQTDPEGETNSESGSEFSAKALTSHTRH